MSWSTIRRSRGALSSRLRNLSRFRSKNHHRPISKSRWETACGKPYTPNDPKGRSARDEKIRRRAYEIYLERGEQPGRELDDWLQAERELELERERGVLRRAQAG